MKKKPHQRQSEINKVFSDFRNRLHKPKRQENGVQYEVIKLKDGYTVKVHRERGADNVFHFKTRTEVNAFLDKIK